MSIDFSGLDNIRAERPKMDAREVFGVEEGSNPIEEEEEPKGEEPAPENGSGFGILEAYREEMDRAKDVYKAQGAASSKCAELRTEIVKDIRGGKEPEGVLLKAIECISLITGDTAFREEARRDIVNVYGWGLDKAAPLRQEREEIRGRLKRLNAAVEAHKRELDAINGKLKDIEK